MRIEGTTALVTGGARGIGRELTRQLVEAGAHVVMVGRDAEQLALVERDHLGRVASWQADLAEPADVNVLIRDLPLKHPALAIVINNAGVQTITDLLTEDPAVLRPVLRREVAINLDAVVALSTGLLPHLRRQAQAAIVNVSSGLAVAPKRSAPVYCATKAAVRTFTRALRYQCEDGAPQVRVMDAVMALVDTDMTKGRGRAKLSAAAAAAEILAGLRADRAEIHIGKAKFLSTIARIFPILAHRLMRNG